MHTNRFAFAFVTLLLALAAPPARADEVRLVNGDRLSGVALRKIGAELVFRTAYAGELKIKWSDVASLTTTNEVTVQLADDTTIKGLALAGGDGRIRIKAGELLETAPLPLEKVAYINPPPEVSGRGVRLEGRVNFGAGAARGNSDNASLHLDAEAVARTRSNRYTAGAIVDRASDQGTQTRAGTFAYLKYDHFLTRKWYGYVNGTFNRDRFKGLNLRTTVGAGAGYQVWESKFTNLSLEGGLNYVNNDFALIADESHPAARWALKYDRLMFDERLQFFHFHELLADLQSSKQSFLRTQTGLRMPLGGGIAASLQFNADYESNPAPGRAKVDRAYLLNLGYRW